MMDLVRKFVERLNQEVKADRFFSDGDKTPTYTTTKGRKYAKVIMNSHSQDSVWGFIDIQTGQIFKAAGWSKPAKHPRGNIETAEYGQNYYWTGPNYLR